MAVDCCYLKFPLYLLARPHIAVGKAIQETRIEHVKEQNSSIQLSHRDFADNCTIAWLKSALNWNCGDARTNCLK